MSNNSEKKVRFLVKESITIGGVRYNSGLRAVEFDHAVALRMLLGDSKLGAIEWCNDNLTTDEKIAKEQKKAQGADSEPEEISEAVKVSNLNVDELEEKISSIEDLEELNAILEAEKAGKKRKTAIEAIESRIEDLSTPSEEEEEEKPSDEEEEETPPSSDDEEQPEE